MVWSGCNGDITRDIRGGHARDGMVQDMKADNLPTNMRLRGLAPIWLALGIAAIASLATGRWALGGASTLALALCLAPILLASRYRIVLPLPFAISTTAFIIASLIFGEVFDAYDIVWWWDIALHASSAIALGLIGFLFIYMLFHGDHFAAPASALAIIAFSCAVSVGGLWEIFEYLVDRVAGTNMQRSGLDDTMTDLMVNAFGAAVGSLVGYGYLKGQSVGFPGRLIADFVALNRHLFKRPGRKD